MQVSDLSIQSFKILRKAFFADDFTPIDFDLRDKRNTQDDPFDEFVADVLDKALPDDVKCQRAPGPLITPDIALARPELCNGVSRDTLRTDLTRLMGIEVKKLERGKDGKIARASGLDYNSTPPCGTIRVYDASGQPLDMRGFYLFVCLERGKEAPVNRLSALALCDGNSLNADFDYYLGVAGERSKEIGVGTYGDGANRNRPMVIFANPLGSRLLDRNVTLVHSRSDLAEIDPELQYAGCLHRTVPDGQLATFHCYRNSDTAGQSFDETDPFPSPKKRSAKTTGRGRFKLNVRPAR
jgi:hypothetical protein